MQTSPSERTGPVDPRGPTGQLVTWLEALRLEDVPADVQTRARHVMLDGIACLLVGSRMPEAQIGLGALADFEKGTSFIAGTDRATGPFTAALINSSFIQGFELDDFYPSAPQHTNSILLPAMIAVASDRKVTGRDFLLAAVAGYETGPRIGWALHGPQMLSRGWHSGVVFGGPAAAAAAGKLLGLDAGAFEDALGIAATQACGIMSAQFESMVKRMQHGFAARNGLYGAVLAEKGYIGIKRVFERGYGGFLTVFGEGHAPDATLIARDLGSRWGTREIQIKTYAAMVYLHAPIDCARALRDAHKFGPDDIDDVLIEVSQVAFAKGGTPVERPLATVGAQMSLQYTVAVALLDGDAMLHQFSAARLEADDVWALIGKTRAQHQADFDHDPHTAFTSRVTIRLRGGTVIKHMVESQRGGTDNPLSNEGIVDKARRLLSPIIDEDRMEAIFKTVLSIDEVEDVSELLKLLAAPTAPPFQ